MPENHFGEPVAARYDESSADMFEPAVVDPVVDFLAGLAGLAGLARRKPDNRVETRGATSVGTNR